MRKKSSLQKIVSFFLNILIVLTLIFQSSPLFFTSLYAASDPFSLTPEKKGIFEGLPEKFKGMFDSSTQRLNGFFTTLKEFLGGASQGSPAPELPGGEIPELPLSGDLLQIDGSWSANCQPDINPDELHEATTDRAEDCDWNLPETIGEAPSFYSDPALCDANNAWVSTQIQCMHVSGDLNSTTGSTGCAGTNSTVEACLIKVDNVTNTYHLHWRLHIDYNNRFTRLQSGDQVTAYRGLGKIESLVAGMYESADTGGTWSGYSLLGTLIAGNNCGSFATCDWGSDGTEDCEINDALNPFQFVSTTTDGTASIAFQGKPSGAEDCCGTQIGDCVWQNDDPILGAVEGQPSEYIGIVDIPIANAIDQGNQCNPELCMASTDCTALGGTEDIGFACQESSFICCNPSDPTGDPAIPCDYYPPISTFENCEAEYYPTTQEEWENSVGTCYFLPDPLDTCVVAEATPENTFDQCPLDANVSPLDLCWGLHDPAPNQYDPSDVGGYWSSQDPFDYTCRNQVPSANIVKYVGGQCNVTENLTAHMRSCTPTYARTSSDVATYDESYIRKLNGCNTYFEGSVLPELGSTPGLPASNPPTDHEGYCQTAESNNLLCSASDGQRCVNADSKPNICRKAVKVETFETVHRTNSAPPADAFTANCLIRETEGAMITCGHDYNCDTSGWSCEDCPGCSVCDDGSDPEYWCNDNNCCSPCVETNNYGCNTIGGDADLCYYPEETGCTLGTTYTDPYCSNQDPNYNCGEVTECQKDKYHCTFPMTPAGDPEEVDGPMNAARNCAVYEWTKRQNIYTVVYESNAIYYSLNITNFSDHELTDVDISVDVPNFLDVSSVGTTLDASHVVISGTTIDENGNNICAGQTNSSCSGHGGSITLTLDSIPAYGEEESGYSYRFIVRIKLVPSDIDSSGNSSYADHELTSTSEIEHYTNNLISDDRLANLEFQATWANTKVVELDAFWIGQGVFSNAGPTCSGDICFVDPDFRPFGWPVFGEINQNWGGVSDSNPLAESAEERYGEEGIYKDCGDEWKHTGIDMIPATGIVSPSEVYSTHAGQVSFAGENANYPDRGYYVEIHSTSDDDCQPNYVTRYDNLLPGSLRVETSDYVPRHKLLGIMGYSGEGPGGTSSSGYTHLTYQIRYGHYDQNWPDIADNNVPGGIDSLPSTEEIGNPGTFTGIYPIDMDPPLPTLSNAAPFLTYQEPDDVAYPETDSCLDNPYICDTDDPIDNPDLTSLYPQLLILEQKYKEADVCTPDGADENPAYFFCTLRTTEDDVRRCFYANP